jgi:putative photosynthetic complex assembly protein 2
MLDILLPVLFAVFVWWFSTGLILLLDNLPRTTFRWSLVISTGLAVASLAGVAHTAALTDVAAAYWAFTCALLVWGWHELTFLTGWITGPRQRALDPGAGGTRRFVQAVQVILWHELAILAMGVLIATLTWGQPNQVGTWTFAVLWAMRTSAKLNLFLGVRNLSEEFLPAHLAYLQSYFRRRPMNLLFPLSVTVPTLIAIGMAVAALEPATLEPARVGLLLVTAMLALAIIEHWMLVLPLPTSALWRWAMRQPQPQPGPVPAAVPGAEAGAGTATIRAAALAPPARAIVPAMSTAETSAMTSAMAPATTPARAPAMTPAMAPAMAPALHSKDPLLHAR